MTNFKILAQNFNLNDQKIKGPLVIPGANPDNLKLSDIVNRVLQFILPLAGVVLLLIFISGGYDFITSEGNPEKVKKAQAKITTGIVGFFILALSYFLVRLISFLFGLEDFGLF